MYLCVEGGGGVERLINIFFKIKGDGAIKSIVGGEGNNELEVAHLYQTKSHC